MTIESHPLPPFLPENATILFLGSFPPPRARWSMEFFYPNWINDFWRIQGLIHFSDRTYFEKKDGSKSFDREKIVAFCRKAGYAFYDTAARVLRRKDNASDNFLEILEPVDIGALLQKLPSCHTVVTTGGKASEELASILGMTEVPAPSEYYDVRIGSREVRWYRMPSTSRAYPLSIEKKKEAYMKLVK